MPVKTWNDAAEWADWTLSHLVVSGDELALEPGYNSGTATLTAPYEAASFDHWSKLILGGDRPQGTNIYVRVRTGADSATCAAAAWSPYIDGLDANGDLLYDLRVHWLNAGVTEGAFVQVEVTLVGE